MSAKNLNIIVLKSLLNISKLFSGTFAFKSQLCCFIAKTDCINANSFLYLQEIRGCFGFDSIDSGW